MPYPKTKSENYKNLGGMNTKVSLYLTDETEFLNLQNVDFRKPGSLSSFAGNTQYSIVGSTSKITGLQEYGARANLGFSAVNGYTASVFADTRTLLSTDAYNVSDAHGTTFRNLFTYTRPNNTKPSSFAFLNYQHGSNESDFWTFPGVSLPGQCWQFGVPVPYMNGFGSVEGGAGVATGLTGYYKIHWAFMRKDGFLGPSNAATYLFSGQTFAHFTTIPNDSGIGAAQFVYTSMGTGVSYGSFGLSGIQVWVQYGDRTPLGLTFLLGFTNVGFTLGAGWTSALGAIRDDIQPRSAGAFLSAFLYGTEAVPTSVGDSRYFPPKYFQNGIYGFGLTSPTFFPQPQIIESFYDQLLVAIGSRVYVSDPGQSEAFTRGNHFDVALDIPSNIVMMKAYFTQCMLGKPSRLYSLSGSGPSTFVLSLVSDEYGPISKRAVVVWNQIFWFLDKKGICQYDGSNVVPVSGKMEDVFNRMNVDAAATEAIMTHHKDRNEVWCAIPIDGSTTNNIIVVYDYLTKAWTTRLPPSGAMTAMTPVSYGFDKETMYYGMSNGFIGLFGSSFIGDNGSNFTSIIKSRFIGDLGDSTTSLFRRLYLDASVPSGSTQTIAVNFYANAGVTTPVYQTTMVISEFQKRIDFGIPAKSLAVEFIYSQSSFLTINGFTIESRFQRAV